MVEAVKLIDTNSAPRIVQTEVGATYDAMLTKKALQQLPLDKKLTALQIHNFIRGMDKVPGKNSLQKKLFFFKKKMINFTKTNVLQVHGRYWTTAKNFACIQVD